MGSLLRIPPVLTALSMALAAGGAVAGEPITLAPGGWKSETSGLFQTWVDRRDLAVLHHPWEVSEAGGAATITQEITLPDGWAGGNLHFYMSDDYDGSKDPVTEGWLGQINLGGHRFKQVLANGEVLWEADVADAIAAQSGRYHRIPLPETLAAEGLVQIAFRLQDRVGSMERLPGDHRHVGETDNISDADPWKFQTHLYVGDVTLVPGDAGDLPPSPMPAVAAFRQRHETHWPLEPIGNEVTFPVTLQVRHAPTSPVAFPVSGGLPFPQGAVREPGQIALETVDGQAVPATAHALNTWPDGSLRWAKVTAVAPPGTAELVLAIRPDASEEVLSESVPSIDVRSNDRGAVELTLDGGTANPLTLAADFRIGGEDVRATLGSTATLVSDGLHQEIEVRGRILSATTDFGPYVLRIIAFTGQPWIRVDFRVFNERPETLHVSRQSLHVRFGQPGLAPVPLAAAGAAGVTGDGGALVAVIRHFEEMQPKAIHLAGGTLELRLVDGNDDAPGYQPHEGEARRHEIWLGRWDGPQTAAELAAHAAWMADPPGLFNADYFCATGAAGMAFPHDGARFPELTDFMERTYVPSADEPFFATGIRHWGDLPYSAEEGTFRNGYYDMQQGFAAEYLMTGTVRWFDRLEATVRHIVDVDLCHASAEHPDWVGSIHGYYGKDHSTGSPWNPMQRTKGTLAYWRLTGDRDARDGALAVADSAIAAGRALGASSVRDHAGILYGLTAAYDETRDPRYLEASRRVAHDALTRVDPRRGTYIEIHGNHSYQGNVPWMVAQLMEPLYDYYRQSGDVAAGEAVVALAESILAENRTRDVPGDVFGYSHNPHFTKTSNYHILIAPAILYAFELTGDVEFLRQARAMYRQTIGEGTVNSILNCYWNTPTLLYYLDKFGQISE